MEEQVNALKHILEVPSFFLFEHKMIERIESVLATIPGVKYWHDVYGNIYAIKGESEVYPLVCAHTDTVHNIEDYVIYDFDSPQGPALRAFNTKGNPSGIGGDNKTGIFICLELLKSQDVLKAAFYIGEEFGCVGSSLSQDDFYQNVGYAMAFDAPDYFWVTYVCNGIKLFENFNNFWLTAKPILEKQTEKKKDPWGHRHPYTDIHILKGYYDFSCLNYSSGYMRMHTPDEYVVIEYVFKSLETAKELLLNLGNKKYPYKSQHISRTRNMEFYLANGKGSRVVKFPEPSTPN